MASRMWLQIDIARAGAELQVTARGSQGQEPAPHRLGAQLPPEALRQFAEWVKAAASRAGPLQPLSQAQSLYEALFPHELREVLGQLRGAAGGQPLLLRLNSAEGDLHAVPWEALCRPGTTLDFLGTSPELGLARGASSTKPWAPCRVEGPVRLLVISPEDERAPERLRAVLHPHIEAGELEWLTPLTGPHASKAYVLQRLRSKPVPHILHFIGHGGLDAVGHPTLRLADKEGEPSWLKVELLAKELEAPFRDTLRLVVLEACEGARPGTLSSAAALLAQAGAGAVVAHLWPVRADVARRCSVSFYRSLAGAEHSAGDVARSLHDARRSVLGEFDESAEAFSPVLYLRGPDARLFSFEGRSLQSPRLQSSETEVPSSQPPPAAPPRHLEAKQAALRPLREDPAVRSLLPLVRQPFSLLLGDPPVGNGAPGGQEELWRQHVASSILCKKQVTIASGEKLLKDPAKLLEFRKLHGSAHGLDLGEGPPEQPRARTDRKSPFTVGPPITKEKGFFGRKREQGEILDAVEKKEPVQLLGAAKMGKSSLLDWAARHLPDVRPVARVGSGGSLSPVKLVSEIARELGKPEVGERLARKGARVDEAAGQLQALGPLVLILDDADNMARFGRDFDEGFFEVLRECVQNRGLTWVSTSQTNLYDLFNQNGLSSRFLNSSRKIWVGPLDEQDARSLAGQAGGAHVERVLHEAGGFAYGIQWLSDRLLQIPDSAEEACDAFRWEMRDHVFASWWKGLTPQERAVLKRCAEGEVNAQGEEALRRHLGRLNHRGFVVKREGRYQLAPGEAWREFVRDAK